MESSNAASAETVSPAIVTRTGRIMECSTPCRLRIPASTSCDVPVGARDPVDSARPERGDRVLPGLELSCAHLVVAQSIPGLGLPQVDRDLARGRAGLWVEVDLPGIEHQQALDDMTGRRYLEGEARLVRKRA